MFQAFAVAALALASGPAQAITFEFWGELSEGTGLSYFNGSFDASDDNGDGFITTEEVVSFRAGAGLDNSQGAFSIGARTSSGTFSIRYELYSGVVSSLSFDQETRSYTCVDSPYGTGEYRPRTEGGYVRVKGNNTQFYRWGDMYTHAGDPLHYPTNSCLNYGLDESDGFGASFRQSVHVTGEGPRPVIAPVPLPAGLALMAAGGLALAADAGARQRRGPARADLS